MYPLYEFGNRFENAHFSRLEQNPDMTRILCNWCAEPKNFLFFHGNVGTGKTYFCAAWFNAIREQADKQRKELKYPFLSYRAYSEQHFFNELKHAIQLGWNPVDRIRTICDSDFIILDDLGSSKMTEWQIEMISELIDLRYSCHMPTLITSNLDRNQVKDIFSERIYDRIFAKENTIVQQNESSRRQE